MEHEEHITVEISWCVVCRADVSVEVVHLPGDPAATAICLECGDGVELWWQPLPARDAGPGTRHARAS